MDDGAIGLALLLAAAAGFVGTHLVLSHAWRARLVGALGENGFQALYAALAALWLVLMILAYHRAPHGPALWSLNNAALQAVFAGVSYCATVLFVGALDNNPALVGANLNGLSTRAPDGAFLITRHPMMFAVALWCAAHIMILPAARNLIACGAMIVLAIGGSRLQDRKKLAAAPREWGMWVSRTRFWPDLRHVGALGGAWIWALVPWLLATWLEVRVTYAPLGLWYVFPDLPY